MTNTMEFLSLFGSCALLVQLLCFAYGDDIYWSYGDGPLGPAHWCELPAEGNQCCGSSQSPINIDTEEAIVLSSGYYFELTETKTLWNHMTVSNDGHTVVLHVANNILPTPTLVYYTSFTKRSDTYLFDSLHFHFGGNDSVGAEHTLDGLRYPMEMHVVFYNNKYPSFADSKNYSDGIVVVGVHFYIGHHNTNLDPLIEALENVEYVGDEATISPGFPLENLLPSDISTTYSYKGSLTTPICQEAVQWFILEDNVRIEESQMETYRSLRTISAKGEYVTDEHGRRNIDEDTYMYDNFRPTQDLNDRVVYHHVALRDRLAVKAEERS